MSPNSNNKFTALFFAAVSVALAAVNAYKFASAGHTAAAVVLCVLVPLGCFVVWRGQSLRGVELTSSALLWSIVLQSVLAWPAKIVSTDAQSKSVDAQHCPCADRP